MFKKLKGTHQTKFRAIHVQHSFLINIEKFKDYW